MWYILLTSIGVIVVTMLICIAFAKKSTKLLDLDDIEDRLILYKRMYNHFKRFDHYGKGKYNGYCQWLEAHSIPNTALYKKLKELRDWNKALGNDRHDDYWFEPYDYIFRKVLLQEAIKTTKKLIDEKYEKGIDRALNDHFD